MKRFDVIIVGAGAAGLLCASEALKRNKSVLILEKANKAGKKILISGGGRCNFTNLNINPNAYISKNPHFCKSALKRFNQWNIIDLLESYNLSWKEKKLGQLFCDQKSSAVLCVLLKICKGAHFEFNVQNITIKKEQLFTIGTSQSEYQANSLVIASGGPSIPKMGASDFGLKVAKQFGLKFIPFKAGLVPFTFHQKDLDRYFKDLAGISLKVIATYKGISFKENLLITHKGLSGPVILQISSYWEKGQPIKINLLPYLKLDDYLIQMQQDQGNLILQNIIFELFPRRLAERFIEIFEIKELSNKALTEIQKQSLKTFGFQINNWVLTPIRTEGLRTAEVCIGGVSTEELSSKTMESKKEPGLYFIGETVDVTGWLGGYNFQWAWSSGWVAGQEV